MTEQQLGWERHLQSLLLGLLTVVVIGFGSKTIQTAQDAAVIKKEVENLQQQITDRMGDRYTGADANAYQKFDELRANNMLLLIRQNLAAIRGIEERLNGND